MQLTSIASIFFIYIHIHIESEPIEQGLNTKSEESTLVIIKQGDIYKFITSKTLVILFSNSLNYFSYEVRI